VDDHPLFKGGGTTTLAPFRNVHLQKSISTMKKKNLTRVGGPSKKKGLAAKICGVGSRASPRTTTASASKATYLEKTEDGREKTRKKNSLKVKTGYKGGTLFEGTKDSVIRGKVNYEKRKSRNGGEPCYDVLDDLGSSIYVYSLPLNLVRGLVIGFKSPSSVKQFRNEADTLQTHAGTNFMFLHWQGAGPSGKGGGDYKKHNFVKGREDLQATIESLGDWISKEILLLPGLAATKQPGVLSNKRLLPMQKFQVPHWDFGDWHEPKAEDLPWIIHSPLCKEGMMVSVWPTKRDHATHHLRKETLELGEPKLIYVAFGDCLVLRADVCHGGSFGSKGNIRFHMVLRVAACSLCPRQLHPIGASGADPAAIEEKMVVFEELLGDPMETFKREAKKKARTVTPYVTCLERQSPGNKTLGGLLGTLK
jgi:hypothetical protein